MTKEYAEYIVRAHQYCEESGKDCSCCKFKRCYTLNELREAQEARNNEV